LKIYVADSHFIGTTVPRNVYLHNQKINPNLDPIILLFLTNTRTQQNIFLNVLFSVLICETPFYLRTDGVISAVH